LSNENHNDYAKTQPGAVDTADGFERNLVDGVSVVRPCLAEANVGQADGTPGEEGSHTGELEQPSEDELTIGSQVHVGEGSAEKDGGHGHQRATRAINVGEDLGGVTLLTESSESAGATVDTGHTNGHD
jgi:hypothetical protein